MPIPFVQFMRPDGRMKEVLIDRPAEIEKLAQEAIAAGVRFECEHLVTEQVSFEAMLGDECLAHETCDNGPEVLIAVDRIVNDAHDALLCEDERALTWEQQIDRADFQRSEAKYN